MLLKWGSWVSCRFLRDAWDKNVNCWIDAESMQESQLESNKTFQIILDTQKVSYSWVYFKRLLTIFK